MSEVEAGEGEYEAGRPLGLYLLVGIVVVLVAVSGMFAIGYIPPLAKVGSHATTSRTQSVQFVTITSTSLTTVYSAAITTSTTAATTTTQAGPAGPLAIDVAMRPPAVPATLHPGESFILNITVQSTLASTVANLYAYQVAPGNTPLVTSFFPSTPESLTPVEGTSYYTLYGTISPDAPVGIYEVDVRLNATSPGNNAQVGVSKQYVIQVVEPLSFTGYKFANPTSQFNGTCVPSQLGNGSIPVRGYQCNINAAPMANGTVTFTVSNAANVPICIQTTFSSTSMSGFVSMNPYPFCPKGATGIYVPAGAVDYVFTYAIENGPGAGAHTVFFDFVRSST